MEPAYIPPLAASLAAVPQAAERQGAVRARQIARTQERRRDTTIDAEPIERPVESVDAVDAIGEHGDDARRRDKHAEPPEPPPEHVDIVA